jgi:competence protein ComEC
MFDAGPARKVLGPLSRLISPFDKSIDAVIITNPDADHIGGLSDIFKNYKVDEVFEPGVLTDSKTYQNFKEEIKKQNIPDILARKGMRLDIGGGAFIDILFPDRDVSSWATNDGSVVARLS